MIQETHGNSFYSRKTLQKLTSNALVETSFLQKNARWVTVPSSCKYHTVTSPSFVLLTPNGFGGRDNMVLDKTLLGMLTKQNGMP